MSKFKVGDTVLRTDGRDYCMAKNGGIYEVASCTDAGGLELVGHPRGSGGLTMYSASSFELVQAATTESKYLTPQQTLENLLNDVPTQAMHCGEWLDINELDNVSVNFLRSMKCRTKPSTVRVGEYEVVKPQQRINIADTRTRYVIKQGLANVEEVQPDFLLDSRLFWETREDAYAALQAIKKTLLGETK